MLSLVSAPSAARWLFAFFLFARAYGALPYEGVNLAGAEFGYPGAIPGTYGSDYEYPTQTEVDYYLGKGMNTFRLPFLWERLQPTLGASFDTAEWSRLSTFVDETTAKGGYVILDPHDFGQYVMNGTAYAVGSSQVPDSDFADLWSRLATSFAGNDHVIFGLMNEPAGTPVITTESWFSAAQSAMDSIRSAGATNLVLVPGNYYTGSWSWVSGDGGGTPNSQVMGSIHDSMNNFAFEVHLYLDQNHSGTSSQIYWTNVQAQLSDFTQWLSDTGNKGFLGEFAVADVAGAQTAVSDMLGYLDANASLWDGWTWWAGGPMWDNNGTNYMFNLDPVNGQDAAQMAYLQPFLPVPEPRTWALLALGLIAWAAWRFLANRCPSESAAPCRASPTPQPARRGAGRRRSPGRARLPRLAGIPQSHP